MGAAIEAENLILPPSELGSFGVFETGTRYLTQLHNDLQSLLDDLLSDIGDDPSVTPLLLQHILDRMLPGLGQQGERLTSLLVLFFDPGSQQTARRTARGSQIVSYNKQTNTLNRTLPNAFAVVGRNADLLVISQASGRYETDLADIPQLPRFGALVLSNTQTQAVDLTADVRGGQTHFVFDVVNPPGLPLQSLVLSVLGLVDVGAPRVVANAPAVESGSPFSSTTNTQSTSQSSKMSFDTGFGSAESVKEEPPDSEPPEESETEGDEPETDAQEGEDNADTDTDQADADGQGKVETANAASVSKGNGLASPNPANEVRDDVRPATTYNRPDNTRDKSDRANEATDTSLEMPLSRSQAVADDSVSRGPIEFLTELAGLLWGWLWGFWS